MLADHRDGLLSTSFSLTFDSSVSLSAGIQSVGDSFQIPCVRILHSAEEDNLSPFDSKSVCLCQSIEINNKHVWVYMYIYMYTIYKLSLDHDIHVKGQP